MTRLIGIYVGNAARSLLQRADSDIVITSATARLEQAVEEARKGDTVFISTPEIELDGELVISVENLHIKGNTTRNRPTIRCVSDNARIEIR